MADINGICATIAADIKRTSFCALIGVPVVRTLDDLADYFRCEVEDLTGTSPDVDWMRLAADHADVLDNNLLAA